MSTDTEWDCFRAVVENLSDGVCIVDRQKRVRYWSRSAERITGYRAADFAGRPLGACPIPHEDEAGAPMRSNRCPVLLTLADGIPREVSVFLHHKSGRKFPARIRTAALLDSHGRVIGAVETFTETPTASWALARISDLEQIAYRDFLTGVANRRFVEAHIRGCLSELTRFGWPFGVVMLDVDDFKRVNDTFGHLAGDAVLKTVAHALAKSVRPFDIAGRWGGDEFLVVIKNVAEAQLEFVAHKLCSAVRRASAIEPGQPITVTASAGRALARPEDTVEALVARADAAMYERKRAADRRSAAGS